MTKYVITGTGRCGTGFISKVLTYAGSNCSHEAVFQPTGEHEIRARLQTWLTDPHWPGESSWMAAPFLHWPELRGVTIIHLVRHPKPTIDSHARLLMYQDSTWAFRKWMFAYAPELATWSTYADMAAAWYVVLNKMIEHRAVITHRVEDDPNLLLTQLGINQPATYADTQYNSRAYLGEMDIQPRDINPVLMEQVRILSHKYNYVW